MARLRNLVRGRGAVITAVLLIAASFAAANLQGGQWNFVLGGRWWFDPGVHAHGSNHHFTVANALMLAAAIVAGFGIVRRALHALSIRMIAIELLVSVAAIGAVLIGNFWEAAAVTALFAIGNALESATLTKTRSALAELVAEAPETAIVLRHGDQVEIPAREVAVGDTVIVKNGAKVPVDGEVISGAAAITEATITGESVPAEKTPGDRVYAGTISQSGFLQVRAEGIGADTTLARIIQRVEEAQEAKAKTQAFIDRFSKWYTPGVMVLALAAGLISQNPVLGLTLLVIGCPGALVISIPVTIVAGIGQAARRGILIKGGEFLETAARISAVALDKTGTLTQGRPELTDTLVIAEDYSANQVLALAAAAEAGSEHPLATAVINAARSAGVMTQNLPDDVQPVPGKGIIAKVGEQQVLVGNAALIEQQLGDLMVAGYDQALTAAGELASAGRTPMLVATTDRVLGVLGVADQVRPSAVELVAGLRRVGIKRIVMLTGDAEPVARRIAAQVGITEVHAGLLPEDKVHWIAQLQADGHTVAMVGDGVNDAPALATAQVGVAMGAAGSAVAVETADIALMGDDLAKVPQAMTLARRTVRIMKQNIGVALVTVALLLAGVFAGQVTMSLGMLAHEASVLLVIANAMRLLRTARRGRVVATESVGWVGSRTTAERS